MLQTSMNFDREGRLRFAQVTETEKQILRSFWQVALPHLPAILEKFYNHLSQEPATSRIIGNRSVSQLKQAQSSHWARLFAANFDDQYLQGVYAVGMAHKRIGLEPRWYIGAYKLVVNELVKVACDKYRWQPNVLRKTLWAINTAVMLDIDLVVSAYQDAIEREKVEQTEIIVGTVGTGLESLAKGDLTHRITAELTGPFEKLKNDFNAAGERLQVALKSVLDSTTGISAGAGEISQAANDLSHRTETQAASLEQTAAALEEITATVKKTAQNAKDASSIVGAAKTAAENGGNVVETAIKAMGLIEQSSKQITDIIGVIDEIAFQTNLLALNAGVEAARAGDAGKGFAVVASEVRALAQRSSEAAREIKTLIKASGEHVGQGVKYVGESGEALRKIVSQVVEINALVSEMAQAALQQSTGIEQVNTAVTQMDQVTQQNAAMVEESTAAARSLASETGELVDLVTFFKVGDADVPARRAASRPAARPQNIPVPKMPLRGNSGGRRGAVAVKAAAQADADDWQEF